MDPQDFTRPIFAPVILGTSRQGRASEYAAHFIFDHVSKRSDIRTDFIDIRNIRLSIDDAGEAIKDSKFSATVNEADALIFVVPEYTQSLLPVLRELGLVTIFSDVYFGGAGKLFDPATGAISDPAYAGRVDKFLNELIWMARALRYARENIPAS